MIKNNRTTIVDIKREKETLETIYKRVTYELQEASADGSSQLVDTLTKYALGLRSKISELNSKLKLLEMVDD